MTGHRTSRWAAARRDEGGFTLPELLVAMAIGLMVLASAGVVLTSAVQSQPGISDRNAQIREARTMAEGITREVRQGSNATSVTPNVLTLLTYLPRTTCGGAGGPATRCRIFYNCSTSGTCTRQECPPNVTTAGGAGCGVQTRVVQGLASNQVFTFSPRAPGQAFVTLDLSFPAANGDDAITIEDGAALRNPPLGGE